MQSKPTPGVGRRIALLIIALALLPSHSSAQTPMGTAFTYQGRLNYMDTLATGSFDLTFTPFDAASDGTQLADSVTLLAVPVDNGLFTVQIDFGADIFAGNACWVEIGVKATGSADPYTILTPRQRLTPTPYAIHAATAGGLVPDLNSRINLAENVWIETALNGELIFRVNGAAYELSPYDPWKHPRDLSDKINPGSGQTGYYHPAIATGADGSAIIAWHERAPSIDQIFVSLYRPTTGWQHPVSINDFISTGSYRASAPDVAMDDEGNAIVVWEQDINASHDSAIFMSEFRDGVWDHPDNADDYINPPGSSARGPHVAMDANNNATIVWVQTSGGYSRIFKSDYRLATKDWVWTHPADLNDYISPKVGEHAQLPCVCMNNNNRGIIGWIQDDGSNDRVFLSEYYFDYWHLPMDFDDAINPLAPFAAYLGMALNDDGDTVVVWQQGPGSSSSHIFLSERRSGVWQHPANATDYIDPAGAYSDYPEVAMNNNGTTCIVWQQGPVTDKVVMMSFLPYTGGTWNHPDDLNDYFSLPASAGNYPRVAVNDLGEMVCIWTQRHDSSYCLFKAEYRSGRWLRPETKWDAINPQLTQVILTQVAVDNFGHAIIVYEQEDEANYYENLYMSEYYPLD